MARLRRKEQAQESGFVRKQAALPIRHTTKERIADHQKSLPQISKHRSGHEMNASAEDQILISSVRLASWSVSSDKVQGADDGCRIWTTDLIAPTQADIVALR